MAQLVPWASIERDMLDAGLLPIFPMQDQLAANQHLCPDDDTVIEAVTFVRRPAWGEPPTDRLAFHVCPICAHWQLAEASATPVVTFEGRPRRLL